MTPEHLASVTASIKAVKRSPACATTAVDGAGRVSAVPHRAGVVIVAFGPTASRVTEYQANPNYEIWCINNGYYNNTAYDGPSSLRADRWFEIHQMHAQPADDLVWMNHCPVPLYVADIAEARKYGPMPNAVQYPYQAIEKRFGIGPWWACTFAYQIALAIHEGFTEIVLLGLEFGSPREWLVERPNVLWWAGLAQGLGITLVIPADSTLMEHPYRYGIEYDHEVIWTNQLTQRLLSGWGYVLTPEAQAEVNAYNQRLKDDLPK